MTPDFSVRLIRTVILAAIGCAVLSYVTVGVIRVATPTWLDATDSVMAMHVNRLARGMPLFAAPTVQFVPLIYMPLFYYAADLATRVTGDGLAALRLVSLLASLAAMWLVYSIVRRESGSSAAGLVAAGLQAAMAGDLRWVAVALGDELMGCLVLAALYRQRSARSPIGMVAAGAIWGLAALTKQSVFVVLIPVAIWQFWADRRAGAYLVGAFMATVAVVGGLWEWQSGGWFSYYTLFVAANQSSGFAVGALQMVSTDVLRIVPFAAIVPAALLIRTLRARLEITPSAAAFYLAVAAGTLGASLASQLLHASDRNVLLPACCWLIVLFAIVAERVVRLAQLQKDSGIETMALTVCFAQFVALGYVPQRVAYPDDADLPRILMEVSGDPGAPGHRRTLVTAAGMAIRDYADVDAVADLRHGGSPAVIRQFDESVRTAVCGATRDRPVVLDVSGSAPDDQGLWLSHLTCPRSED